MGWTSGYVIASATDVARFYYDLLGPEKKFLSKETVSMMELFEPVDLGL